MATIYDVARLAGVSTKTVSRVLNNDAPVSPHTREAVQEAIAELGYIPSSAARTMRSNRSGLIGLITGAISQSATGKTRGLSDMLLVQGALKSVSANDKTLMIADTGGNLKNIEALFKTFLEHRVEGILYVADQHSEITLPTMPRQCPVVLVNCFDKAGTPSVLPDDFGGQQALVSAIIQKGHNRIAYLTLPPNVMATKLRTEGYKAALAAADIPFAPELLKAGYPNQKNQSADLEAALSQLLSLPKPPTAICCGNDEMALRVYALLRIRGIKVPEQISVAGYDNDVSITETLLPPLTSADLPYIQMGIYAGELLLNNINGQPISSEPVLIPSDTIWRTSVAKR